MGTPEEEWDDDVETSVLADRACLSLRCVGGPLKGSVFGSDGAPVTLGRGVGCAIRLPIAEASRRHATIYYRCGTFWIRDLGTLNGTLVNGQAVHGDTPLEPHDRIQVGAIEIEVILGRLERRRVVQDDFRPGLESEPSRSLSMPRAALEPMPLVERAEFSSAHRAHPLEPPGGTRRGPLVAVAAGTLVGLTVLGFILRPSLPVLPSLPSVIGMQPDIGAQPRSAAPAAASAPVVPPAAVVAPAPALELPGTVELEGAQPLTALSDGTVTWSATPGTRIEAEAPVVTIRESRRKLERELDEVNAQLDDDDGNPELQARAHELSVELAGPPAIEDVSPVRLGVLVGEVPQVGARVRAGQVVARLYDQVRLRVDARAVEGTGALCVVRFADAGVELRAQAEPATGPQPSFLLEALPPRLGAGLAGRVHVRCN